MMLVLGLFFLPASLIVAWLLSRFKLDKSVVLNATLCGAFAVVLFLAIRFYNFVNSLGMSTDVASESLFSEDPGFRLGMVAIFAVSWVGAMALTWWLKKRRSEKSSVDLEAFE